MTLDRIEQSAHSALWAPDDLDVRMAQALGPKANAFLAYRQAWKQGIAVHDYPLQIDVELNASCNLRCPMCTYADGTATSKGKESWMSLGHFEALVADGVPRGLCAVGLNGINEPLVRHDLPEFVQVARDAGVLDIMLHTNGTLLTPSMSARLIGAGLTRLFVSLDALTDVTYRHIRVGAPPLDRIEEHIATFREIRGTQTLPVLGVCFVRTEINAHELDGFVKHWEGRADFITIQEYMNPWTDRAEKDRLASLGRRPSDADFKCPQPFQRLRLSAAPDHQVRPCCSFYGEQMSAGTLADGILNIWRGPLLTELRSLHRDGRGRSHPVCRECIAHSYTERA